MKHRNTASKRKLKLRNKENENEDTGKLKVNMK